MKKVLLAFDGVQFSEGALKFAAWMNQQQPIFLTAVFIPEIDLSYLWSYANALGGPSIIPLVEREDSDLVRTSINRVEAFCSDNKIPFSVHERFLGPGLYELRKEMRFADLIVIGSETFCKNLSSSQPNQYLRDVLHEAECPVVVVPEKFRFPQKNIIAYDGSASSVHAMKMFTYIFPELANNETILAFAGNGHELPEKGNVQELASYHFANVTTLALEGKRKNLVSDWLKQHQPAILITGSFGRSTFSEVFRESFAAEAIREHELPLFIAHR